MSYIELSYSQVGLEHIKSTKYNVQFWTEMGVSLLPGFGSQLHSTSSFLFI